MTPALTLAALAAFAQQPARPDTARRDSTSAQKVAAMRVTAAAARRRGYAAARTTSATKTDTPLRDTPQSVSVVSRALIADQAMQGMADVARYVPGVTMSAGEGNRDQPTIRGVSTTADFFVDGVRDDAQYYRDLYNVEQVEALKGSNAMIFGRGGGGGVINRVTKEATWATSRAVTIAGGSFDQKRATLDVGQALGSRAAARLNGVYERSETFRDVGGLRRFGVNPTAALALSPNTTLRASYEYFDDERATDRGIPSYAGRPSGAAIETFFGNPSVNTMFAHVHQAGVVAEHRAGALTIRNRLRLADYDKFYQNTFPGAVNAAGTQVALSAYNHAIGRRNLIDQTDVTLPVTTGFARHTLLAGAELTRQRTDQVRMTGYFDDAATSVSVPFAAPTVDTPVTFRQSATDAANRTRTSVAAAYAQDQVALGRYVDAVAGVRYERFGVRFHNDRTGQELSRVDALVSPRAGLVVKPAEPVSVYGSYSVSFLPSSGDQFTSLTVTSQTLEPERFTNREVGVKWDARPDLALTLATYRLDRTNTSAPDPTDASKVVQTGAQRSTGVEAGVTGSPTRFWQVAGGFAAQRARIVSTTSAAKAGQTVPLVPNRTLSLWNRVQLLPTLGAGLGVVHQSDMYAAIDDAVTLPAFTRLDGALYVGLGRGVRAQVNVENLLDTRYYGASQGNNNIMPGAPRTVRVMLSASR
jgi:catecholate siderophore receptor